MIMIMIGVVFKGCNYSRYRSKHYYAALYGDTVANACYSIQAH